MFRHQGTDRTDRHNRLVAGYLSFVGGYVNSAGFVLVGFFTSHVTGNVGRLASDVTSSRMDAAGAAMVMIGAFVAGAFVASLCIESHLFARASNAYATALTCEAVLLIAFTVLTSMTMGGGSPLKNIEAEILCAAMGMQNSLVTRLSGAVVRTTHLTGVFTDLGIEAARWFRWWRGRLSNVLHIPLTFGRTPPERPPTAKVVLLGTIAFGFTSGALVGSALGLALGHASMILPSVAVAAAATYAFRDRGRKTDESATFGHDTRR